MSCGNSTTFVLGINLPLADMAVGTSLTYCILLGSRDDGDKLLRIHQDIFSQHIHVSHQFNQRIGITNMISKNCEIS